MATELITPEIQPAPTQLERAADTGLKPNEFEALVMRYGIPSDEGRIMEAGSLASCSGKLVVVHWEHSVAIGIAKLAELPNVGVFAHGRLAPLTATGLYVALLMQQGILKELCLSSKTIRASRATLADGREFTITHEAEPVELSITLRCGIPGTGILKVGPLSLDQTEWDQKFYPQGTEILKAEMGRTLQFYADVRKKNTTFSEEEYEQWIRGMSF